MKWKIRYKGNRTEEVEAATLSVIGPGSSAPIYGLYDENGKVVFAVAVENVVSVDGRP